MNMGSKIKMLRKSLGMTQTELGERVGVKKNAVSKWECGRVEGIPASTLKTLASLFNVPVSYLVDDDSTAVPAASSKIIPKEDIIFALFHGREDITDEMYAELQNFADYLISREEKKSNNLL